MTKPSIILDTQTRPRYRWRLLRAGRFRLDGGSMFGLIPRSVWSKAVATDDRGRIEVQHNCLLLERVGDGPGAKLVILEVGTGDKMDAKSRDIFALEDRSIINALHEADCRPEDIGLAVVTHLHFDHAGGLTRLCRSGEHHDWIAGDAATSGMGAVVGAGGGGSGGGGGGGGVKLTFPNAVIVAQLREWRDALDNKSVMTRTYFRDHLDPIRERIKTVDSPRPFPTGYTPGREELPMVPVQNRITWLADAPGVGVFLAPGHTWGQQAMIFTDDRGRTVVFVPDVMPTAHHVGAAYSLGYDVEPYTSMVTRHWLLDAAVRGNWTLVLDHEPGHAVFRAKENGRGWYELTPDGE